MLSYVEMVDDVDHCICPPRQRDTYSSL